MVQNSFHSEQHEIFTDLILRKNNEIFTDLIPRKNNRDQFRLNRVGELVPKKAITNDPFWLDMWRSE